MHHQLVERRLGAQLLAEAYKKLLVDSVARQLTAQELEEREHNRALRLRHRQVSFGRTNFSNEHMLDSKVGGSHN